VTSGRVPEEHHGLSLEHISTGRVTLDGSVTS